MSITRKTILLVEDEPIIAMMERQKLEGEGYRVVHASSGEIAIELVCIKKEPIDLILMDIDLGKGIDGTETAKSILECFGIPILFLSSHTEKEIVKKTESITNYGYVVKNSNFTVLDASIKMAFKLFEANEDREIQRRKLELANNRYHLAFNLNPDAININKLSDGTYLLVNQGFTELSGYTLQDVIGKSSISPELNIWADAKDRQKLVTILNESKEVLNLIAKFRCKDGTIKICSLNAKIITIEDELCIMSITKDITEQKKIEETLHLERKRLESIINAANVGTWELNVINNKIKIDDKSFAMLGYTRKDLNFEDLDEWLNLKHTDERNLSNELLQEHIQGKTEYYHLESRMKHKDGSWVWILARGKVSEWDNKGIPIKMFGTHQDITERKHAEHVLKESQKRYRFALEGSELGEWDWDLETNRVQRNERWAEMLGYTLSDIKNILQSNIDLQHPDDRQATWKAIQDHLDGRTAFYNIKYRLLTKDGKYKWIRDCGKIMERDEQGKPLRLCGTHADIDAQVEAEDEIKALLTEKDLLLREVHHRIKNNMETISALLQLQANTQENPEAQSILSDAASRVKSMEILYEKLYLSGNLGKLSLKAYIPSLINEIIDIFPKHVPVKIMTQVEDIVLDTKLFASLGIIINELITNSMKYAFKGVDGVITMNASRKGTCVYLEYQDNGIGLPENIDFANSTGFGMQLVKMLVEQVGGTIRIERSKGTKFLMEFEA